MIGMITFQFSTFSFGMGNAAGLLFAGIMLGFMRANHPTFGYIPQGALSMVKEFGLMAFMAGVVLSAGSGIRNGLGAIHRRSDVDRRIDCQSGARLSVLVRCRSHWQ